MFFIVSTCELCIHGFFVRVVQFDHHIGFQHVRREHVIDLWASCDLDWGSLSRLSRILIGIHGLILPLILPNVHPTHTRNSPLMSERFSTTHTRTRTRSKSRSPSRNTQQPSRTENAIRQLKLIVPGACLTYYFGTIDRLLALVQTKDDPWKRCELLYHILPLMSTSFPCISPYRRYVRVATRELGLKCYSI